MRPIVVTVGPLAAASGNSIAQSQTPGAAGALTLNGSTVSGGVAYLGAAQRVLVTSAGNDSAHTFTITGTNASNDTISEVLTGPNAATVTSVLDYLTVKSIVISAAAAGAITVGTGQTGASPWVRLDDWNAGQITLQCNVTGTVNYTAQTTNDDPNSPTNPVTPANMTWIPGSFLTAQTTSASALIPSATAYVRVLLNSGSGSVAMTVVQAGSATY
jgi:VCBS repeat-containing protein